MLRELRLRGIKNLSSVVVDKSIFGEVAIDPNAFDNAGDRPYNAAPDAMMAGLGAVRLLFYPDAHGKKWVSVIDPPLPGVRVIESPEWAAGRCPGAPQVQTRLEPQGDGVAIRVTGKVAGSCDAFSVWRLALSQDSTKDITDAIEKANATNILILPNNKNIIMAAEQAAELAEENVAVVPTQTIPQGISAMLAFHPEVAITENKQMMDEARKQVKTGDRK